MRRRKTAYVPVADVKRQLTEKCIVKNVRRSQTLIQPCSEVGIKHIRYVTIARLTPFLVMKKYVQSVLSKRTKA